MIYFPEAPLLIAPTSRAGYAYEGFFLEPSTLNFRGLRPKTTRGSSPYISHKVYLLVTAAGPERVWLYSGVCSSARHRVLYPASSTHSQLTEYPSGIKSSILGGLVRTSPVSLSWTGRGRHFPGGGKVSACPEACRIRHAPEIWLG